MFLLQIVFIVLRMLDPNHSSNKNGQALQSETLPFNKILYYSVDLRETRNGKIKSIDIF